MTKILPFLTARYTILCTRRLQPPRDDGAVQVQWFSDVFLVPEKKINEECYQIYMVILVILSTCMGVSIRMKRV